MIESQYACPKLIKLPKSQKCYIAFPLSFYDNRQDKDPTCGTFNQCNMHHNYLHRNAFSFI